MADIYSHLKAKQLQEDQERALQKAKLEKELAKLTKRRDELRKIGSSAIDPAFVRRSIDKCSNEIDKILKML